MSTRSHPPKTARDPEATRQRLLEAAFSEFYEHGFQAASLDNILAATGVTKGALYHHFKNKLALGYAVIDDLIAPIFRTNCIEPMARGEDPVESLRGVFQRMRKMEGQAAVELGCPLNNLAQEMSPLDEGFRRRLQGIFDAWQRAVADALRRGQAAGTIRDDIDPDNAAFFILAAVEGTIGLAKNHQSEQMIDAGRYGLDRFLDSLRPDAAAA